MKTLFKLLIIIGFITQAVAQGNNEDARFSTTADLVISSTKVTYDSRLEQLVFSIKVNGKAGASVPKAVGSVDGAPVLGYVFPTSLKPEDVGFKQANGIVALALTSHPDFDDTPLWDEDNDQNYANDGLVWHAHWVVLHEDKRVPGGLSVVQFDADQGKEVLPPTNPGMPMYMDSPGFSVLHKGQEILVIVPAARLNHQISFNFDAVTAYMEVNTSQKDRPMLGVYAVYSVASGDLSLPYTVIK